MKNSLAFIVPTKNRPQLLTRAVRSIRNTCGDHTEIVVVNDGDPLGATVEADLKSLRTTIIANQGQRGAAAARNVGVAAAISELVAFLDDDDELLDGYLDAVSKEFPTSLAFRWVGIDSGGITELASALPPEPDAPWLERSFAALSVGIGFGLCVRRESLLSIGGFDETLRLVEDTDLILRLLANQFDPLPVPLRLVKVNSDAPTRQTDLSQHEFRILEAKYLLKKHSHFFEKHREFAAQLHNGIEYLQRRVSFRFHESSELETVEASNGRR